MHPGADSNAEAIHEAVMDGRINGEVVGVICDHKGAQVLERAACWHVPSVVIEKKDYPDKAAFDEALLRAAVSFTPDLICLAGYGTHMQEKSVNAFHTGLSIFIRRRCRAFRGLHAQRQAIEAGVKVAGCTVHFVGTGLDDGPIITQTAVPVYDNDTEETLSARILTREHPTYVRAVAAFCADKLMISGNHVFGMHSEEE